MVWIVSLSILSFLSLSYAQYDPHYWPGRDVMVHLMDWKFSDIADECERFLAPKGFGGVQLSPVSENKIVDYDGKNRPWWERYQPISYKLHTRSGTEQDFLDMSKRCNAVGIRLFPDVILNHMAAKGGSDPSVGTAGSTAVPKNREYPAVPYSQNDFNQPRCGISNWGDVKQIRNCNLVGLEDLNQTQPYVREKLIEHLNHMIDLGMAGFRIDAAKHMWPGDLKIIFESLKDLNTDFGFEKGARPFIFQEVIDYGNDVIKRKEYTSFGPVTDFKFSQELSNAFRGNNKLKWLVNFGPEWGLLESKYSFCFVDNHDNQRDSGDIITYKSSKKYKMVSAFSLAHPHGHRRIMSSFDFKNRDQGPPQDKNGNILSPIIEDVACTGGWVCEHRWRQIFNMVDFRNVVAGTSIKNWWDNNNNQIAFGRGDKGFIIINGQSDNLSKTIKTGLPIGRYCDVISGQRNGNKCTGIEITVAENGYAHFDLPSFAKDGVIAIHVGSNSRIEA